MVTVYNHNKVKGFKTKFGKEKGTAFGGIVLLEKLSKSLGLWRKLEKEIPHRRGHFDWMSVIKSSVVGLLTGSRGTYATQEIREDEGLLELTGLSKAPEEATFWRCLDQLGSQSFLHIFQIILCGWLVVIIRRVGINRILRKGFLPVFGDGSILEGSERREGTKYRKGKGYGLLWTNIFVGPFLACQGLNGKGEGEGTLLKKMIPLVVSKVLKPLRLLKKALVLMDSLHGNGPMMDKLESLKLFYIIGARGLKEAQDKMRDLAEGFWINTGSNLSLGISESGVCMTWVKCLGWKKSRTVIGYRYKKKGEFIWNYSGVLTNLSQKQVEHLMKDGKSFPETVWELYGMKGGLENYYKNLLEDLGLHHPPCQELQKNAGFYALGSMAYNLGLSVEMIGSRGMKRGETKRKDGKARKRPTPRTMRMWRLIRRFFALPAKISTHARKVTVEFLKMSETIRNEFEKFWENILRC